MVELCHATVQDQRIRDLEREMAVLKQQNEREVEAMDAEIVALREQRSALEREVVGLTLVIVGLTIGCLFSVALVENII